MLSPILLPEKTEGGIIRPDGIYRKTNRGVVIKKGPACASILIDLGTECFFPSNHEFEVEIDQARGWVVYLVRETDIIMYRRPLT